MRKLQNTLAFVGPYGRQFEFSKSAAAALANAYGLELQCMDRHEDTYRIAPQLKFARMALIWNGRQGSTSNAGALCNQMGIPHAFIEMGMLPQRQSFMVDPEGFCGYSFLNRPLGWVNADDMSRLYAERQRLQEAHPIEDDGAVIVLLQVFNDTQILYHTGFQTMSQFVRHICVLHGGCPVVIRPHPKAGVGDLASHIQDMPNVTIEKAESKIGWLGRARTAKAVVGMTSTALWEAAILGKPVVALGNHPLRKHANDVDRVCAAALAMRVSREAPEQVVHILARHGIRPLEVLDD